jgi:hypothetical protein
MTRPRPRRTRVSLIPFMYRKWLISGRPYALIYLDSGTRVRELWEEYGALVTERHIERYGLFRRPINWWRLSAPDARHHDETEYAYLTQRHPELLTQAEKRRLGRSSQLVRALQRASA